MIFYLILILLTAVYFFATKKYSYWSTRNVPHEKPTFLLGNYGNIMLRRKNFGDTVYEMCLKFDDAKYIGAYFGFEPVLIPKDPETIKLIMTKDFYYFNGREMSDYSHKEPAALNLFASHGDNWKVLRQNMTPLFTSAKMKNMFHIIEKCAFTFEKMLDREVKISDVQEIRYFVANFTIEGIVSCAFGIEADTMGKDIETNPFKKIARSMENIPSVVFFSRILRRFWPSLYYFLGFRLMAKQLQFFFSMITRVMAQRNYKPSGRHDFVDLITSWKQNHTIVGDSIKSLKGDASKVSIEVTDDLLVAQCWLFFTAGFETSATTSSYTLYELAKHEDIQNRVLEEVDAYMLRHNNRLQYECLNEMPYLEACIDEALRLYPVLGVIPREVMEDYTFPDGVKVTKGMRVDVPAYYMHHNPKYFEDPEEYRPERFLGDAKKNIIPYTYMPFGEGPRTCIGLRFAKMQMLAGLITLLKKYRLELPEDMPKTLQFTPMSFITQPVQPIRLRFVERTGWEKRVFVQEKQTEQ